MHCSQINILLSCCRSLSFSLLAPSALQLVLLLLLLLEGDIYGLSSVLVVVCLNNNLVFCFPF